jgi:hypothetical protein
MALFWFTAGFLFFASFVDAGDQSMRERARSTEGGSVSNSMEYNDPVVRTPQLFEMSDLVIHAKVTGAKGVLIENDSLVATVYTIEPYRILKQKQSLRTSSRPGIIPSNLVVRRVGGTLIEGPYKYSTKSSSFPDADAPTVGDEVVWFLIYRPDVGLFNFAAGAFAAFRISGDQVVALTEDVKSRRGDVPVPVAKFFRDLDLAAGRK